ncbi:hypothetical protein GCM10009069_12590 [Algimonas arctica]|uniref:Lipoprotein n=1 Tax=Algimonas arctica TaxID=1479486 RepID=A0A8J3G1T7_9PROT|nr:hypothetical protein [Algimonas arctica]GHA90996.1 hypothetical protein GCM10009069_12590 [Algimonas arctica]
MRRILVPCLVALSACSTTPDPADVCTAAWIEPRVERAVERIETRLDKALRAFRTVGDSWMNGNTPGPIQMFRLSNAANDLEKELVDGRGIRDLRMLASTCNDPNLIREQVYTLLDREGLPDPLLNFLDATGILEGLIETAEGRNLNDRNG